MDDSWGVAFNTATSCCDVEVISSSGSFGCGSPCVDQYILLTSARMTWHFFDLTARTCRLVMVTWVNSER